MANPRPSSTTEREIGIEALAELTLNVRWAWHHGTDELWAELDPELWALTHNPWVVLQTVSRSKLSDVLARPEYQRRLTRLVEQRRDYLTSPAWFQQNHPQSPLTCVTYFSMEYALTEALPIYSGGLGNVAGDQLKAASDLGVTPWGTLAKVVWPLSLPGVIAGATFTFCLTFGDFIAPFLVGGPDGVMVANVITSQYGAALNWPLGSALAVILLIIVLAIIELSDRMQRSDRIGLA